MEHRDVTIDSLPAEIHHKILSYLPTLDLEAVSRVSKAFNTAAKGIKRDVYCNLDTDTSAWPKLNKICDIYVQSLVDLDNIETKCNRVALILTEQIHPESMEALFQRIHSLGRLVHGIIIDTHWNAPESNLLSYLEHVHDVIIASESLLENVDVSGLTEVCNLNVSHSDVKEVSSLQNVEFIVAVNCKSLQTIQNLPKLRVLDIRHTMNIETISGVPTLERIVVSPNSPLLNLPSLARVSVIVTRI